MKKTRKMKKTVFFPVLIVLGVFFGLTVALIGQNIWKIENIKQDVVSVVDSELFVPDDITEDEFADSFNDAAHMIMKAENLLIWDSEDNSSKVLYANMKQILDDMKYHYAEIDIRKQAIPDIKGVNTIVVCIGTYSAFQEDILKLVNWTEAGGQLLIAQVPEAEHLAKWVFSKIGVEMDGEQYYQTKGIKLVSDLMLHGNNDSYVIEESFLSSRILLLEDDCNVHIVSDDEKQVPILWDRQVADGKAVVVNLGIYEKAYRGIYASALSLLGEVCAYPVINGAVFYLDDFPAPIPDGYFDKIKEDYGMNIKNFYKQVWWNDIVNLGDKYGVPYTGLVIEVYSEQVEGPFVRNADINQYRYLGNMLRKAGGEIGFHGYNHMPLALKNFDYKELTGEYKSWPDYEAMKEGIEELKAFCEMLFPDERFSVYVPPSNVLSDEGRQMLAENLEDLAAIAALYISDEAALEQEFDVGEDGIINTPRIISGCILDDYMKLSAFSELNFHYVSSHFQHPDDVLDAERGAEEGWEVMRSGFADYMEWLDSASDIRKLTGSELAGAVQRFYYIDLERKITEEGLELELEHLYDEAWFFVRFNEWEPDMETVQGGELEKLQGNLYLLKATDNRIEIKKRVTE